LKERIQFAARRRIGETVESAAIRDRTSGPQEPTPRCARQCAPDADAPDTHRRDVLQREIGVRADQEIDGFGGYGSHHGDNVLARANAGRVQAIRSRERGPQTACRGGAGGP